MGLVAGETMNRTAGVQSQPPPLLFFASLSLSCPFDSESPWTGNPDFAAFAGRVASHCSHSCVHTPCTPLTRSHSS